MTATDCLGVCVTASDCLCVCDSFRLLVCVCDSFKASADEIDVEGAASYINEQVFLLPGLGSRVEGRGSRG